MKQELTRTPTALANVDAGTRYFIQNHSLHTVHFITAASVPTDRNDAAKLSPDGDTSGGYFRAESGESCYVWINNTLLGRGEVFYDEAP